MGAARSDKKSGLKLVSVHRSRDGDWTLSASAGLGLLTAKCDVRAWCKVRGQKYEKEECKPHTKQYVSSLTMGRAVAEDG
jgi:hypothetical protein